MLGIEIGTKKANINSETQVSGFEVLTATEGSSTAANQYKFIKAMTVLIYERIFYSALNALSMDKNQTDVIKGSAADKYTPYSEGFIRHLAKAAAMKSTVTLYVLKMEATGELRFTTNKDKAGDADATIELDFSKFEQSALVASITNMMFSTLDATATGLKASKTLFLQLAKLAENMNDKKFNQELERQVKAFDTAMKSKSVVVTDAASNAKFMEFDTDPATKAMGFCFGMLSTITGYPAEFFNGVGGSTMSDTGASTEKAIHRANEHYATSIVIPFIFEAFSVKLKIKPLLENIESLAGILTLIETSPALSLDEKKLILSNYGLTGEGLEELAKQQKENPAPPAVPAPAPEQEEEQEEG